MLKITEVQTFITGTLAHTNEYYSIVIVNSYYCSNNEENTVC